MQLTGLISNLSARAVAALTPAAPEGPPAQQKPVAAPLPPVVGGERFLPAAKPLNGTTTSALDVRRGDLLCASLPAAGSAERNALVASARAALDPENGPGWVTLDTAAHFPAGAVDRLFKALPPGGQASVLSNWMDEGRILGEGVSEDARLPEADLRGLQRFARFMEDVLSEALGKPARISFADIRAASVDHPGKGVRFEQWHVDGLDLAVLVGLKGTPTQLLLDTPKVGRRDNDPGLVESRKRTDATDTPLGHALTFSAVDRGDRYRSVKPTIHRTPPRELYPEDRLIFLMRVKTEG